MELKQQKCVTCEGGMPRLGAGEIAELLPAVEDWRLLDHDTKLARSFLFRDFKEAIAFVNRMATLAEAEGHHPDFTVRYAAVDVIVTTHDIGGLSRNDFILAAKIADLTPPSTPAPPSAP